MCIIIPKHTLNSGAGAGTQCSDPRLLACQNNFNTFLNIQGHADWHVPLDLYAALLKIYAANGTNGFLQVCQAYTQFSQCLGPMYASCNNPLFYLQHGYSILTAAYYPAVIAQMHFQCGGGLETAIYNWGCVQSTGRTYNQSIVNCNVNYAINASADPAHACTYAANDMMCVSAPFKKLCGGPTGWYLCEYTRVGLAAHLPMCTNLRCRVSGSVSDVDDLPAPLLNIAEQQEVVEHLKNDKLPELNMIGKEKSPSFFWPDVPSTPEDVLKQYLSGPNSEAAVPCQDQTLLACQANFNTFLNISGHADWHVPLDLYQALLQIYSSQGTNGFLKVCQAYTQFSQCLGTQYASCNNPLFYLQHGYTIITAAYYPAIIAQLHFQCGGGLETAIYNWNCIQTTGKKYGQQILNCNVMYATNATSDPAHTCTYANNDLNCNRAPFVTNCNAPTAWYICEYTRVGLASHLPQCTNLRCRVGASSEPAEPAPVLPIVSEEEANVAPKLPDLNEAGLFKGQLDVFQQIAAAELAAKQSKDGQQ